MDFELSSEQTLLKDSVDRFVQDNYEPEMRRKLLSTQLGYSEDNWKLFAEMGWLGLPFPEAYGGYDGTAVETAVLMESFGAGLVLEPFVSTVLLGGKMVQFAGTEDQKTEILGAVVEGQKTLALAYGEPQSKFNLADVMTEAKESGDGYVINGHKSVVYHAASADTILVTCRTSGERFDKGGISVFLVDANAKGLTRKDYRTLDGQRASEVILEGVEVQKSDLLGNAGEAFPHLENVIDLAMCATSSEAVGAMNRVNEITNEYTKTRNQFGKAIGDNQIIQHRLADMLIEEEQSKAMADMSAMRAESEPEQRPAIASATKARICEAARFVGEQGIQLHGGIGMTDEYVIGHYYKRLMVIEKLFGNADFHLKRFAEATQ